MLVCFEDNEQIANNKHFCPKYEACTSIAARCIIYFLIKLLFGPGIFIFIRSFRLDNFLFVVVTSQGSYYEIL